MSRSRRTKSQSAQNKRVKKNAIQTYKLIDTLFQSLLFVYFLYGISADTRFDYQRLLVILACVQVVSIALNFSFSDSKQLQKQRVYYLVAFLVFCPVFFYVQHHVKGKVTDGYVPNIPIHVLLLLTTSMALAFWYIVICYKEFRSMFGAINTGSERASRR